MPYVRDFTIVLFICATNEHLHKKLCCVPCDNFFPLTYIYNDHLAWTLWQKNARMLHTLPCPLCNIAVLDGFFPCHAALMTSIIRCVISFWDMMYFYSSEVMSKKRDAGEWEIRDDGIIRSYRWLSARLSNSSVLAMELLKYCTKPSISCLACALGFLAGEILDLTLYMLNCSGEIKTYVYILCHSSTLTWHR